MEEVVGSIPASSTQFIGQVADGVGYFLGGFVAGEGCFTSAAISPPYADGTERRRFVFAVALADRDLTLLHAMRSFLGGGSISRRAPQRAGWKPTATFSISSNRMHLRTTIPFADRYLLPSSKLEQYRTWRSALLTYLDAHPTRYGSGPSTCRISGCPDPVRGRGLCRSHYYQETGY